MAEQEADLTPAQAQYLLRCVGTMHEWVHRRVETISFRDESWVTHRCSVDFTPPPEGSPLWKVGDACCYLVPITFLRRGSVLTNFDCRDEDNSALPVLTTFEQTRIEEKMLLELARYAIAVSDIDDEKLAFVEEAVKTIRGTSGPSSSKALDDTVEFLKGDKGFQDLITRLERDFLLITPLVGLPDRRRVVKFCYDQVFSGPATRSWSDLLYRKVGWEPVKLQFPADSAGHAESYHFAVTEPPELAVVGNSFFSNDEAPPEGLVRANQRGHIIVSGVQPESRSVVQVQLAIKKDGWLDTSVLSAWACTALLFAGVLGFSLRAPRDTDAAAAVVIALAAFLPVAAARSGEHPLAAELLSGVRSLLLICAALAMVAGARVAFFDSGQESFSEVLALAGVLPALAVTASAAVFWAALTCLALLASVVLSVTHRRSSQLLRH